MRRGTTLLIGVLLIITVIFGLQFAHRAFGVNTGFLTIPEDWLRKVGFPTDEQRWLASQPSPTPVPTPPPTPVPPDFGKVLAVPIVVEEGGALDERISLIQELQPRAVTLFGKDISLVQAQLTIGKIRQVSPNSLILVDHEGGTVQRLRGDGFTVLPSLREQCALSEEALSTRIASSAAELSMAGVDVVLGPVLDLNKGGNLGARTCSIDTQRVASMFAAYADQLGAFSIKPVVKHYPGIGSLASDLHFSQGKLTIKPDDTSVFFAVQATHPKTAIMVSFAQINPVEGEVISDNVPCALSRFCVTPLKDAYPDTVIISDALEMEAARTVGEEYATAFRKLSTSTPSGTLDQKDLSLPERSTAAMEVGIDLLMYGPGVTNEELREVVQHLQDRYDSAKNNPGVLLPVRYNDAVRKLDAWSSYRQ